MFGSYPKYLRAERLGCSLGWMTVIVFAVAGGGKGWRGRDEEGSWLWVNFGRLDGGPSSEFVVVIVSDASSSSPSDNCSSSSSCSSLRYFDSYSSSPNRSAIAATSRPPVSSTTSHLPPRRSSFSTMISGQYLTFAWASMRPSPS